MEANILRSKLSDVAIPTDISLADYILNGIDQHGDKIAMIDSESGEQMTYSNLAQSIRNARRSFSHLGLIQGDIVLMYVPNRIEYPVAMYSVVACGATVTTCNNAYTSDELVKQLRDSAASYIVTTQELLSKVKDAVENGNLAIKKFFVIDGNNTSGEANVVAYSSLIKDNSYPEPVVQSNPKSDIAFIPYSSGTSGLPKGVLLSHYNLLTAIHQCRHPDAELGVPGDIYISFLPFFHMYGITVFLMYGLLEADTIVVMSKFDPVKYLQLVNKYQATVLHVVPPVALLLAKHPLVDKFDLTSVREVVCAAAPLKAEMSVILQKRLNLKYIKQGYGMTELSPLATYALPSDLKHGSAGTTVSNTEIKIVNLETKENCGANEQGEVCVRGPQIMIGYLNNQQATKDTIDGNGWLHTGDVGYYDEDEHLYIVDRIKELIKFKGYQVAPAELEGLLITHTSIADAAVIGIPDEEAGELPRAYIVLKPDVICTEEDVHNFLKEKVAHYKRLRGGIDFVTAIPKSPSGKILRRKLKEAWNDKLNCNNTA